MKWKSSIPLDEIESVLKAGDLGLFEAYAEDGRKIANICLDDGIYPDVAGILQLSLPNGREVALLNALAFEDSTIETWVEDLGRLFEAKWYGAMSEEK